MQSREYMSLENCCKLVGLLYYVAILLAIMASIFWDNTKRIVKN